MNPEAPNFVNSRANNKPKPKKTNTLGAPKDIKNTEISLLKHELVIAKTKLLQIEADKKDLERKNKILSESIKIHESEQSEALRKRYFGEPVPGISAGSSSSSTPPPRMPTGSGTECGLDTSTINRLVNYFLDVLEQTPSKTSSDDTPPSPRHGAHNPDMSPSSHETSSSYSNLASSSANNPEENTPENQADHPPENQADKSPANQAENPPENQSDNSSENQAVDPPQSHDQNFPDDVSMSTIDEFTEDVQEEAVADSGPQSLNCCVPTIQSTLELQSN